MELHICLYEWSSHLLRRAVVQAGDSDEFVGRLRNSGVRRRPEVEVPYCRAVLRSLGRLPVRSLIFNNTWSQSNHIFHIQSNSSRIHQ